MTSHAESGPITILIVDDYEPLRSTLCRLYSHYSDPRVVGSVATGDEAIERVVAHLPAVIVMDVNMPGIGGAEATRRILILHPSVRVIAHSALDHSAAMLGAGAVDCVSKGSPAAVLLAAIRRPSSHESMVLF